MDINITNPVTTTKIGEVVNGANAATPNDTDLLPIVDTSVTKKITLTNFKAFLKTYFDTLYTGGGSVWGSITGTLSDQTDLQNALNNKEPLKGSDDNYVTDAEKTVIQNTSGTNTGDNATNSTSNTYADGKVEDAINDGTTTIAPSQNAVFDALAAKAPLASPTFTGVVTTPDITVAGLTSTRVVFATTGGALTNDANLTFGSGNLNVGTSVTTPSVIGGSAVGSQLIHKSTTGNGTAGVAGHVFTGGNNGATTIMSLFNNANVQFGAGYIGINTAAVSNQPITSSYSFGGTLMSRFINTSSSTIAVSSVYLQNNVGLSCSLNKLGFGYATAGLLTANLNWLSGNQGNTLYSNSLTGTSHIWTIAGTAGSNEVFRALEAGVAISGGAGTKITAATAYLHLAAGEAGANKAPFKFTTGTNNTIAEVGTMEYNNTFHLTNSDATRRHVVLATNTTKVTAGAPYTNDGYIVVNIGGTDFKLMTTP